MAMPLIAVIIGIFKDRGRQQETVGVETSVAPGRGVSEGVVVVAAGEGIAVAGDPARAARSPSSMVSARAPYIAGVSVLFFSVRFRRISRMLRSRVAGIRCAMVVVFPVHPSGGPLP